MIGPTVDVELSGVTVTIGVGTRVDVGIACVKVVVVGAHTDVTAPTDNAALELDDPLPDNAGSQATCKLSSCVSCVEKDEVDQALPLVLVLALLSVADTADVSLALEVCTAKSTLARVC